MIDLKKLEKLVALMVENDLTEIDLADEKENVTLRRGGQALGPVQVVQPAAAPAPAAPSAAPASAGAGSAPSAPAAAGPTIDSPMVGSFYAAASPDAPAFVKAGDTVTPDTVVCIIEAMKVFNEIKAEKAGTIAKVLVNNGDAVEFGQALFELK